MTASELFAADLRRQRDEAVEMGRWEDRKTSCGYEALTPEQRQRWSEIHFRADGWGRLGGILHGAQSSLLRLANQTDTPPEVAKAALTAAAQLAEIKQPPFAKFDELRAEAKSILEGVRS